MIFLQIIALLLIVSIFVMNDALEDPFINPFIYIKIAFQVEVPYGLWWKTQFMFFIIFFACKRTFKMFMISFSKGRVLPRRSDFVEQVKETKA